MILNYSGAAYDSWITQWEILMSAIKTLKIAIARGIVGIMTRDRKTSKHYVERKPVPWACCEQDRKHYGEKSCGGGTYEELRTFDMII